MSLIRDVRYARDVESAKTHSHMGYHQMIYIHRGEASFLISEREYHVKAPAVVFIGCHEPHAVSIAGDVYERIMVNVYPHKLGMRGDFRLFSVFSDHPSGFCHLLPVGDSAPALFHLLSQLWQESGREDDEFSDAPEWLLSAALLLLYRESPTFFPRTESKRADTVQRIKYRLETEVGELPSLSSLGQEFHLSPYYLAHMFKDMTGYSIKNYHLLCRVAATRELLETTDLSIADICARVGFADMSSLARYFKREIGCTPSQYRKRMLDQSKEDLI